MKNETVDKYMTSSPHTIGAEQVLATAHRLMRDNNIRHLPVLSGGELVGMISDRDLKLVEAMKGVSTQSTQVSEAMSPEVFHVSRLTSVESVAREMARRKIGAAVVMDGKKVVGIFTAVDALEALAWMLDRLA